MTKQTNLEYDIVVFGATGYSGSLIAEYLANRYGSNIRLAIAGRNEEKLQSLRNEIASLRSVPMIIANSNDYQSIKAMVERTKLVVSCTGPFLLYGSNVVKACAETGTDYVDVTGEVFWYGEMLAVHGETAKKSGARIIPCCGFDSIPSDLGVWLLQNLAMKHRGTVASRVKMRVQSLRGGPLGGSHATLEALTKRAQAEERVMNFMLDPFALAEGFQGPSQPMAMKGVYDDDLESWAAPFLMHNVNSKIVHRTNALLGFKYGKNFVYDEMSSTGPGEAGKAKIAESVATLGGFNPDGVTTNVKPGDGPNKEERDAGFYSICYYAIDDGRVVGSVTVKDDVDPGGGSTCKLVGESAMCLLQDNIPVGGGFWTPASAMGEQLFDRLVRNQTIGIKEQWITTKNKT